jgi:hypothetical protein
MQPYDPVAYNLITTELLYLSASDGRDVCRYFDKYSTCHRRLVVVRRLKRQSMTTSIANGNALVDDFLRVYALSIC